MKNPTKIDWFSQDKQDLEELKMYIDSNEDIPTRKFNIMCKKSIMKLAFNYLEFKKEKHENVKYIK